MPQEVIKHKIFKYVSGERSYGKWVETKRKKRRKTNKIQTHLQHNENMKKERKKQNDSHTHTLDDLGLREKECDPEKWFENLLLIL